jgi:hypothetical protein
MIRCPTLKKRGDLNANIQATLKIGELVIIDSLVIIAWTSVIPNKNAEVRSETV